MSNSDFFLIVNAKAKKGKSRHKYDYISSYFKENGYQTTIGFTQSPEHAVLLAKKAAENGFKTIVAIGGDGTVNEVVNGIMLSGKSEEVKMGIIPFGRGNDFAWSAKIPTKIKAACDLIIAGNTKKTDVGFVSAENGKIQKYFVNGNGFGIEPLINFRATSYKHLNGMPSYVFAFVYCINNIPSPYKIKLQLDNREVIDLETQQLSVSNGIRMGSVFKLAPRARIDDGYFDVMYTKHPIKGSELIKVVSTFLSGKHINDKKNFEYTIAKKILIESSENDVKSHIDGEELTREGKKFEIEILPGELNLIRP